MVNLLYSSLLFALPILAASSSDEKVTPRTPCAVKSTITGGFFDLKAVHLELPDPEKRVSATARNTSWSARGWDYGANFTLNICGPVLEKLEDVDGVDESRWRNVSAFYEKEGTIYSIGQQNDAPIFRGRRLILNYTDGSPCPSDPSRFSERADVDLYGAMSPRDAAILRPGDKAGSGSSKQRGKADDDDDDDDDKKDKVPKKKPATSNTRRRNTIISLACAPDVSTIAISFVGTMDSCSYFFEARSQAACQGVDIPEQTLGPAGVFGVIALIAVLVYLAGGCVYQRTVMHQRGWRQLPNYSLWAGIGGFFKDMAIIAFSSCTRFVPQRGSSRAGYSRLNNGYGNGSGNSSGGRGGRGGGRHDADDENRLIDELDEDWAE